MNTVNTTFILYICIKCGIRIIKFELKMWLNFIIYYVFKCYEI
jgi:hypothetical protein